MAALSVVVPVLWSRLPVHDLEGRCESCHLSFAGNGKKGRFVRDINYLCTECHNVSAAYSHPSGMIPSFTVPEEFPLDWSGRMTCATCHDPHGEATGGHTDFIRTSFRGRAFCELCHKQFLPVEGRHLGAGGRAHSRVKADLNPDLASRVLDEVSRECLNCHDGIIGSDASYHVGGEEYLTYKQRSLSHPIGIDYRQATMRDSELRAPETLSPYIVFFDGKVGCGSCHNVYSREKNLLVVSNRGSALCLECHIK